MRDLTQHDRDRLLTSSAAEEFLALGRGMLAKWRCLAHPHQPPYIRVTPHCIRYRLSDLYRYVAERTVTPPTRDDPADPTRPGPVDSWEKR